MHSFIKTVLTATIALMVAAHTIQPSAQDLDAASQITPLGRLLFERQLANEEATTKFRAANPGNPDRSPDSDAPLPTCTFPGARCGALNQDGSIAVPARYDWMERFHDGRALVRLAGLYGYVDTAGREIVPPRYEIAGTFERGYAQVVVGDLMGLIDRDGRTVIEPRFGYVDVLTNQTFWTAEEHSHCQTSIVSGVRFIGNICTWNRFLPKITIPGNPRFTIAPGGKVGIADSTGKWLRTPDILARTQFVLNQPVPIWIKTGDGWGTIDGNGSILIPPQFDEVRHHVGNIGPAKKDGKWGYIDDHGQWVIAPQFDTAGQFERHHPRYAIAGVGKSSGLIDRNGAWVLASDYDRVSSATPYDAPERFPSKWIVEKAGKYGLFDDQGRTVVMFEPALDRPPSPCAGRSFVGSINRAPVIFSPDGTRLIPPVGEFTDIQAPSLPGIIIWHSDQCGPTYTIKTDQGFGLVDQAMQWIAPPEYDFIGRFTGDLAPARKHGKFGVIRRDGHWQIEPRFEDLKPAVEGHYAVRSDGKWGVVKPDGSWLGRPIYDDGELLTANRALVRSESKVGLVELETGKWLIGPQTGEVCRVSGPNNATKSPIVISEQNGRRAVHDGRSGAELIPPRYERVDVNPGTGALRVMTGGKWGIADSAGEIVVPLIHDTAPVFEHGQAWVKVGDTTCAIDTRGNRISHVACDPTQVLLPRPDRRFDVCRIGSSIYR